MNEIIQYFEERHTVEILIRLACSMFAGMFIGIDRGVKRRGAGVKTHALVCLSSALVMLTGEFIYHNFEGSMDVSRLGAQVISGVGFLGVGTIIVTGRNQVRGLTTAAGLWACACTGLAIGIGFYDGAIIMFVLAMFTLKVMTRVDAYVYKHSKTLDLYIGFYTITHISSFLSQIRDMGIKMTYFEVNKSKVLGEGPAALITIEMHNKISRSEVLTILNELDGVRFVEEL